MNLAKDDIEKIFDKNYSLTTSTGIGLHLAKELMKHKLKGEINAFNTQTGICFEVMIQKI